MMDAKYYGTKAELPTCDEAKVRDLVYIKETAHFEYCDADISEWASFKFYANFFESMYSL